MKVMKSARMQTDERIAQTILNTWQSSWNMPLSPERGDPRLRGTQALSSYDVGPTGMTGGNQALVGQKEWHASQ